MTPESEAVVNVANLMALAARTAPKGKGVDTIGIRVVTGSMKNKLSDAIRSFGEEHGIGFFLRDAKNVRESAAVVLIGSNGRDTVGVNCGACGYPTCAAMAKAANAGKAGKKRTTPFEGPNCAIRMADLGIAVGSAVKTASIHNADNRVMYSAGVGGMVLKLLPKDCTVAYGIPLAAAGKNIFFDRTS